MFKRSLVTWVVCFGAVMLAVPSGAAPIAPGTVPIKGDMIQLGTLFHVDYWISSTAMFVSRSSAAPRRSLRPSACGARC